MMRYDVIKLFDTILNYADNRLWLPHRACPPLEEIYGEWNRIHDVRISFIASQQ